MKRTIVAATGAVALVLGVAGCGVSPDAAPSAPTVTRSTALPTPSADVPVAAATLAPPRQPVAPVQVTAPSIGVDLPVVPVGVEQGGFMELPADPAVGGWYRFGVDAASSEGAIVISAHVDSPDYPIGPLSRLRELASGAEIVMTDAAGRQRRYTAASITYYPKAELPVDELFARTGDPVLVLITCGGGYDASVGRYTDNVVAVATPAG